MPVVAVALVGGDGRVLVQQRPRDKAHAGLWEFPGGKIETGETPEEALVRELREEIGIMVDPADLKPLSFASAPAGDRHLLLLLYVARSWRGEPRAIEATAVTWTYPVDLRGLPMPPADRPLVEALIASM